MNGMTLLPVSDLLCCLLIERLYPPGLLLILNLCDPGYLTCVTSVLQSCPLQPDAEQTIYALGAWQLSIVVIIIKDGRYGQLIFNRISVL